MCRSVRETNLAVCINQLQTLEKYTLQILFHILDEAEVTFPFNGKVQLEEPETEEKIEVDANDFRQDYVAEVESFRDEYRRECYQTGVDYVELDTSMQFDKALLEYLLSRRARG